MPARQKFDAAYRAHRAWATRRIPWEEYDAATRTSVAGMPAFHAEMAHRSRKERDDAPARLSWKRDSAGRLDAYLGHGASVTVMPAPAWAGASGFMAVLDRFGIGGAPRYLDARGRDDYGTVRGRVIVFPTEAQAKAAASRFLIRMREGRGKSVGAKVKALEKRNPLGSWYLANPRAPREAGVTVGGTFRRGWSRSAPGHYAHALGRVVKRGKHWYGSDHDGHPAVAAAGGLAFAAVGGAMNAVERKAFRRGSPAQRVAMARPGKPARYAETRPVMFDRIFLVYNLPEGGSESWLIAEGESIHDFLRKHPGYRHTSQAADELAEDDNGRLFRPFTYMVRNDAEAERRLAQERADREARRAARRAGR